MTFKPIKAALDTLNVFPDGWENQSVTIEPNEPKPDEIQYERKWVALLTVPNQENKAHDWLRKVARSSFTEPYWPRYTCQVSVGPRRRQVACARSIFPGMMFASIAIGIEGYNPFREFENTPGIRGYLRTGQGHAAFMSIADMCLISAIEIEQNQPPEPVKACVLKPGDKVKIIKDLMQSWPAGTIARLNRDGSYRVEIPGLFGTMRLLANQVEAV